MSLLTRIPKPSLFYTLSKPRLWRKPAALKALNFHLEKMPPFPSIDHAESGAIKEGWNVHVQQLKNLFDRQDDDGKANLKLEIHSFFQNARHRNEMENAVSVLGVFHERDVDLKNSQSNGKPLASSLHFREVQDNASRILNDPESSKADKMQARQQEDAVQKKFGDLIDLGRKIHDIARFDLDNILTPLSEKHFARIGVLESSDYREELAKHVADEIKKRFDPRSIAEFLYRPVKELNVYQAGLVPELAPSRDKAKLSDAVTAKISEEYWRLVERKTELNSKKKK